MPGGAAHYKSFDRWRQPTAALLVLLAATLLMLTGCQGTQSALDPAGPQSGRISALWWQYLSVTTVVYVLVIVFLFRALGRRRKSEKLSDNAPELTPPDGRERRLTVLLGVFATAVVITLLYLGAQEFITAHALGELHRDKDPLRVKITARQWWWEVQYLDSIPSNIVTSANEIHIPVGRTVELQMDSTDVIHSMWIPNLSGKKDIIPGHPTTMRFRADRAEIFDGQCAEFCGFQHAHMRLQVHADPPESYTAWFKAQQQSAPFPQTDTQKRGFIVFASTTCALCHSIQGTPANGRIGPDLTHVAGRQLLAAGSVPNTRGNLAGWILNPQQLKPGARMPQHSLSPEDLRSLLDYLETLK